MLVVAEHLFCVRWPQADRPSLLTYLQLHASITHLPHDSTLIPAAYRDQFVLNEHELAQELIAMTDSHTAELFAGLCKPDNELRFPASRLLVDVERFADDAQEVMAARGMGVVYTHTSKGTPLRRELGDAERTHLLDEFYHPHHARFAKLVTEMLRTHGKAFILDAHSFPSIPRPYELSQESNRPEICIGTDKFHTPVEVIEAFAGEFKRNGFTVAINTPFAGAIVPLAFYQRNRAVTSVMIEINRSYYMDELTGTRRPEFQLMKRKIGECCQRAIQACGFGLTS